MDFGYKIRRAQLNDTYDLHNIERKCFSTPWGREAVESEITYENGVFLVAADSEDYAVGYVSLRYVLDEGYINNVAVLPEHRCKGIATALLTKLESECADLGLSFISLEVRISNTEAKKLYSSLGYKLAGRRRRFYRLPEEDALIYTKEL